MKHIFAIAFIALSACSTCCAPTAQADLATIKAAYVTAVHREYEYRQLPVCTVAPAPQCLSFDVRSQVLTASYNASAALMTAESEETPSAIAEARKQVDAFTAVTKGLPVQ